MNHSIPKQFEKICFARTGGLGDVGAFERALKLCDRTGAELSIVSVSEIHSPGILGHLSTWGVNPELLQGDEEISAEHERLLETARRRNIRASADTLRGTASLEVIRKVQSGNVDLLIKAAEPTSSLRQFFFGHVDRQLVRKCPCPVWIDKPSGDGRHERILAAVDPSPFRDEIDLDPIREELNGSILQLAVLLAELERAELHVVHAWHFPFEGPLHTRAGMTEEAVAEAADSYRRKHAQALADLLLPFDSHISRVHLLKGQAAHEISRLAAEEPFDVVVMGTVCRTGISGWLIGNTAETILNQIECSIVALKPPGFVSPVSIQ